MEVVSDAVVEPDESGEVEKKGEEEERDDATAQAAKEKAAVQAEEKAAVQAVVQAVQDAQLSLSLKVKSSQQSLKVMSQQEDQPEEFRGQAAGPALLAQPTVCALGPTVSEVEKKGEEDERNDLTSQQEDQPEDTSQMDVWPDRTGCAAQQSRAPPGPSPSSITPHAKMDDATRVGVAASARPWMNEAFGKFKHKYDAAHPKPTKKQKKAATKKVWKPSCCSSVETFEECRDGVRAV
eukprot:COSAG01_NODE_4152_length_5292_cov_39.741190_2_plen_237_part_00